LRSLCPRAAPTTSCVLSAAASARKLRLLVAG